MFDLNTGQSQQVGAHEAPIKSVRWIEAPTGGILATGSWDKTVKVNFSLLIRTCDD
jgi:mRNA export factor